MQVKSGMKDRMIVQTLAALALVLAISLIGFVAPEPARAQSVRYSQVKLSIWPEYDDPRVLVIMEPVLADSVKLPTKVSFLVPKGAQINMACEITAEGGHSCRPKEITPKGKYDRVSYTVLSRRTLFFEYYYAAAARGVNKKFTYKFVPTDPVGSLNVEVQQPLKATNFKIEPKAAATGRDQQGFTYYQYRLGPIKPSRPLPFTISYTKTDPATSVQKPADDGSGGGGAGAQQTAGSSGTRPSTVIVVLGLMGLLGTAVYWMLGGGRGAKPAVATAGAAGVRRRASGRIPAAKTKAPPAPGNRTARGGKNPLTIFCSNCGGKLRPSDKFCTSCGASQVLVCAECGARCDRGSQFCGVCGSELAIGKM